MNKIYIGKTVATHGIKGEIKIISDFPYKEKAFRIGSKIEIDENEYTITGYRKHKNYDMITLEGYWDINEVLPLIKKEVYKTKEELNLQKEEVLDSEFLSYSILTEDLKKGVCKEIFYASPTNKIARIELEGKEVLIPFVPPFIKQIDYDKKQIIITLIEGM